MLQQAEWVQIRDLEDTATYYSVRFQINMAVAVKVTVFGMWHSVNLWLFATFWRILLPPSSACERENVTLKMELISAWKTCLTRHQISPCRSIRQQSLSISFPEFYSQTPFATRDRVPAVVATNHNMILMFVCSASCVRLTVREKARVLYWLLHYDVSRCCVPHSPVSGSERHGRRKGRGYGEVRVHL
jgi:hypothetical protein